MNIKKLRSKRVGSVATTALGLLVGLTVGSAVAPGLAADDPAALAPVVPSKVIPGSQGDAVGTTKWGDISAAAAQANRRADGTWDPDRDVTSLHSLAATTGVHTAWRRGMTGEGVTVAVIDTGIAPVVGLDGQVVNGPDFSFDGQAAPTRYADAFGHGTHLAGIIAGRDPGWNPTAPTAAQFAGVAPDARLLNIKVGATDGGADVSQVIAALDWVTQHRNAAGLNVRVISLAYGTASAQPWQVDPLAHAVENAWRAGIVVVASAGNDGLDSPKLLMPAVSPTILAVGAFDPNGTDRLSDNTVASFTSGGNPTRRPDVLAPGRSLVSLRVPGSYADTMSPQGRVLGDTSGRFFRGSGTSQATAFVAGQVALLLDARPNLTPDQVKALLVSTARPLTITHPAQGAGMTDVIAAASAPVPAVAAPQAFSTGTGSLELSRGGEHVLDPATGVALSGEVDVLGGAWDATTWPAASAAGRTWDRGVWNGRTWTGDEMLPGGWEFAPWDGATWGGEPWLTFSTTAVQWEARSWRGDNWEARSWREESWQARSWRSLS